MKLFVSFMVMKLIVSYNTINGVTQMFSKRLTSLRKRKGLSQYKLAEMLNLTRGQIANYEQGKRQPDFDTLQLFADFFITTTDYLLGRTNESAPPQAKQEKPNFEEYVLSATALPDATIRIAELDSLYDLDSKTFTHLSRLAYNKFGLPGAKGSPKAAGGVSRPGTGALGEDTEENDND
jgi:transcriptional regulator with XRE-family HTH domain